MLGMKLVVPEVK